MILIQFVFEYFKWILNFKFQRKLIYCCFSDKENFDRYNLASVGVFYGIFFLLLIVIFSLLFLSVKFLSSDLTIQSVDIVLIPGLLVLFIFCISAAILRSINEEYCKKSDARLTHKGNSIFRSDNPHHAIVFARQDAERRWFISDSVDLLVKKMGEDIPCKVYPISSKTDFDNVYSNPNIHYLWIIGHGWRGGFYFSTPIAEEKILYSHYPKNSNLKFIAQLHCNDESQESLSNVSLVEKNNLSSDQDLHHFRFPFQNRCYITKKVKEFLSQIH